MEYDLSTRAVCKVLDIELIELEDWNCCGATAAYAVGRLLSVVLPARNLAIAEGENMDILAPCAGCFHFLARANNLLKEKPNLKGQVNEALGTIGLEFKGEVEIRHPLDVMVNDMGLERIKEKVIKPLRGLRVAPYYGCLLIKPPSICTFDSQENPQTLDKLITALGAECVDSRSFKTRCCGGALVLVNEDTMLELSSKILTEVKESGAQCIVTACPFCHFNLDIKQSAIKSAHNLDVDIPVLYFTQLLGLALGIQPKELGLDKVTVSPRKIIEAVVS